MHNQIGETVIGIIDINSKPTGRRMPVECGIMLDPLIRHHILNRLTNFHCYAAYTTTAFTRCTGKTVSKGSKPWD